MHLALYAFMLAMPMPMPMPGWLVLSAAGKPIPFFVLRLPALLGADKLLADSLKEIHETIGTIGCYLIGLPAAALMQPFVGRNSTLLRTLPRRDGRRERA